MHRATDASAAQGRWTAPLHLLYGAYGAICLVVFLLLAGHQLALPGLHYDEAKEAGLNAMQLIAGQPVTAFRDAAVEVGPWRLPLMVQDYIGALNVVLALPFLAVGGINVVALRWLPLCIAGLTLVSTGRVAQQLGGRAAAVVAMALLAVNPTFIFWSRQGIFVTNLTALLFVASLWAGLRWLRTRRPADLWLLAGLWGLGLYAKLLFIWAIGAMAAVAAAAWGVQQIVARRSAAGQGDGSHQAAGRRRSSFVVRRSAYVMAVVCFLLPLLPLILFNLQTGGTLISVFSNLGQSYYGVNNRAYLSNLLTRLGQLNTLLRGDHLWYLGEVYANRWAPWLAAGAAVCSGAGLLRALWRRLSGAASSGDPVVPTGRRPGVAWPAAVAAPFILAVLIVAQSAFTVSDLFITHYALLTPLIPLGMGLVASGLISAARDGAGRPRVAHIVRSAFCILYCASLIAWAGADLTNTLRYHRVLSIAGGYGSHSDAIYRLAQFLAERQPAAPLALDWGVDAPVRFLTVGQVNPVEVFGYERLDGPDEGFVQRVEPFLANPDNLYVAHAGEFVIFRGRVEALERAAAARGLRLAAAGRFGERSGRPLFLVYQAVRP